MKQLLNLTLIICTLLTSPILMYANNYYWVGGTGNWSDLSKWKTSSGGLTSWGSVPGPNDNVYFDNNSFTGTGQSITIDVPTANCMDMVWTGALNNPTLAGPSGNTLKIYGSMTFIQNMTRTFTGPIYFESLTTGKTIDPAGKTFTQGIYFNGAGGSWTLLDSLNTSGTVFLYYGTLNTNGKRLTAQKLDAWTSNTRALNLGSSTVTLTGNSWTWWTPGANFTFNAGTSTVIFTGTSDPGIYTNITMNFYNFLCNSPTSTLKTNQNYTFNFNNITLNGNAELFGNNTYNNMLLTAGKIYRFEGNKTHTFTSSLAINGAGSCDKLTTIETLTSGSVANFVKTSGNVSLDWIALKGINVGGGAVFTATNAIDLGFNSGWNITTISPRNLYWVGNSGTWTDQTHWSLSPGGAVGECPPTAVDNVYFDAASFSITGQTVTINTSNAFCKNMNWTGALNTPTLAGSSSNNLKIFGSLTFITGMNKTFNGPIYFESNSTGNTITSAGKTYNQSIYFNGGSGEWILQDSLKTTSTLFLNYGTINTNGQRFTLPRLDSWNDNARGVNFGSSTVTITNSSWCWWAPGSNFTLNAGTSHIILTGSSDPGFYTNTTLNFYDVTLYNPSATLKMNAGNVFNFNTLTLTGGAELNGNNTYNDLILYPGKLYKFESNKTHNITNSLTIGGSGGCGLTTTIQASSSNTQSTIRKTSGNVTLSYVSLKDINATGGAVFTANNSINLGNNPGWTITGSGPRDLYWVGNSGNWTDQSHWALSSGGPGGECEPTSQDNVFFDANSFTVSGQTITINSVNALCKNMDWTGVLNTPNLAGSSSNNLKISGSLKFIAGMNKTFNGPIHFESTSPGNTITSGGQTYNQQVNFSGGGGSWVLHDELIVNAYIFLNNGTLNTNGQTVSMQRLDSWNDNVRGLQLGNSLITITGSDWCWWTPGANFSLNAGTSTIYFTGSSDPGIYTNTTLNFYDAVLVNPIATLKTNPNSIFNFNSLKILGNCEIYGNNTYNNLELASGGTFRFEKSKTQTIVNNLVASGGCGNILTIHSTETGTPFILQKTSGNVDVYNATLRDVTAAGGAVFNGYNINDLGGNTGWNFSTISQYPVITVHPDDSTACEGGAVSFTIAATGYLLSYQWYESTDGGNNWTALTSGGNYSGTQSSILHINNLSISMNNYLYRCNVSSLCTLISSEATLTIVPNNLNAGIISGNTTFCSGGNPEVFTVAGIAGATYYLWSVPAGALINSGQGTTSISVSFPVQINGDITVSPQNICSIGTQSVLTVSTKDDNLWYGVNTNWDDSQNWECGYTPTQFINAIIPTSPSGGNFPVVGSQGISICKDISVGIGASVMVNLGSDLSINGNVSNNGNQSIGGGKLIFAGTSPQSVSGAIGIGYITINNGSTLTLLNPGNSISGILLCNGNLNANGNLTLLSSATGTALVDGSGIGSISGTITMQRFVPAAKAKGYKHFSSAFNNSKVGDFASFMTLNLGPPSTTPFPTLFKFSEAAAIQYFSDGWVAAAAVGATNTPVDIGIGYTAQFGAGGGTDITAPLSGIANNGDIYVNVTRVNPGSGKGDGWNLVGNPYPSPIDLGLLPYTAANLNKSISIFISTSTFNGYYGYYNAVFHLPLNGGTRYLSSQHAFFVQCNSTSGGTLTFTNAMRSNNINPNLYKEETNYDFPLVKLAASAEAPNSIKDETAVMFLADATIANDMDYDAGKIMNNDIDIPNIYSVTNGSRLALNGLPDNFSSEISIPLGFSVQKSGLYTIEATEILNLPVGIEVYLEDNALGKIQNLSSNPVYTFAGDANSPAEGRFMLKFSENLSAGVNDNPNAYIFNAWSENGNLHINIKGQKETGTLNVYDALGRLVMGERINSDGRFTYKLDLPTGNYILRYVSGENMETVKVFIK